MQGHLARRVGKRQQRRQVIGYGDNLLTDRSATALVKLLLFSQP